MWRETEMQKATGSDSPTMMAIGSWRETGMAIRSYWDSYWLMAIHSGIRWHLETGWHSDLETVIARMTG